MYVINSKILILKKIIIDKFDLSDENFYLNLRERSLLDDNDKLINILDAVTIMRKTE